MVAMAGNDRRVIQAGGHIEGQVLSRASEERIRIERCTGRSGGYRSLTHGLKTRDVDPSRQMHHIR